MPVCMQGQCIRHVADKAMFEGGCVHFDHLYANLHIHIEIVSGGNDNLFLWGLKDWRAETWGCHGDWRWKRHLGYLLTSSVLHTCVSSLEMPSMLCKAFNGLLGKPRLLWLIPEVHRRHNTFGRSHLSFVQKPSFQTISVSVSGYFSEFYDLCPLYLEYKRKRPTTLIYSETVHLSRSWT